MGSGEGSVCVETLWCNLEHGGDGFEKEQQKMVSRKRRGNLMTQPVNVVSLRPRYRLDPMCSRLTWLIECDAISERGRGKERRDEEGERGGGRRRREEGRARQRWK